jgi:hypothetical protein
VLTKLEAGGLTVDATPERELALPDPDDEPFLGVALAGLVDHPVTGNLSGYPAQRRRGCAVDIARLTSWRHGAKEISSQHAHRVKPHPRQI